MAGLGRDVLFANMFANMGANGPDSFASHLHAIGSHIGNQANGFAANINAFIQLLCCAHGDLRPHAQLA